VSPWPQSRLRHRPLHRANDGRRRARGGRVAVSRSLPAEKTRLGGSPMGHFRAWPASQTLQPHRFGPRATCQRNRDVAAFLRGRFKSPVVEMKRSLRSWLWRIPIDDEVDEELALHVEMRTR